MLQTAKSRSTDYMITEKHVSNLIRNLSDGEPHDCLDQMDRYMLDVVSDVFLGESADTLSTESQPLRHAVEEMYIWNTTRVLIGYLSLSFLLSRTNATKDDCLDAVGSWELYYQGIPKHLLSWIATYNAYLSMQCLCRESRIRKKSVGKNRHCLALYSPKASVQRQVFSEPSLQTSSPSANTRPSANQGPDNGHFAWREGEREKNKSLALAESEVLIPFGRILVLLPLAGLFLSSPAPRK